MDNFIKVLYDSFPDESFSKINHSNHQNKIELERALCAAELASTIYVKEYDRFIVNSNFPQIIKYNSQFGLKWNLISSCGSDDKILVIRGSDPAENWYKINFRGGCAFNTFVLARVGLFLIASFLTYYYSGTFTSDGSLRLFCSFASAMILTIVINVLIQKTKFKFNIDHVMYSRIASLIISELDLNNHRGKLLVIGHSMSGGIGEEIILKLNSKGINTRGYLFNKAASKITNDPADAGYRKYAIDHRLQFDILSLSTFFFIQSVVQPATLGNELKGQMKLFYYGVFTSFVFLFVLLFFGISVEQSLAVFICILGLTNTFMLSHFKKATIYLKSHKLESIKARLVKMLSDK